MLDLSVDEDYVIVKDGQRGKQFCVVVDRIADRDHPLLPYPALGSTDRAIIRPAPGRRRADRLPGHATRPCPAGSWWPFRWARRAGAVRPGCWPPREDAELEGLDADDAGRLLLLVWNVAGGGSEVVLLDPRTGEVRTAPELSGLVVTGALLSRDGSTAVMSVEGPQRPRQILRLDTATLVWTPGDRRARRCRSWRWSCPRWSSSSGATGCR